MSPARLPPAAEISPLPVVVPGQSSFIIGEKELQPFSGIFQEKEMLA
jgi:hypothetical protein